MADARGFTWPSKTPLSLAPNLTNGARLETADKQLSPSFDELIAEQNADDFESGEWIKATVDNLGRYFNDDEDPMDTQSQMEEVLGATSAIATATTPLSLQEQKAQTDQLINSLMKSASPVPNCPSVASIPSLPGSQFSASGLSSEERACLEEIERGSQLTAEEKELLENSKKEFQVLDFQDLVQDKSDSELLNTHDLVNQALDFDSADNNLNLPNNVVEDTVEQDVDPIPSAIVSNPAFSGEIAWQETPNQDVPMKFEPTQVVSNIQTIDKDQTLQIVLQDDQGLQQVLTIDQKSISESLQRIHGANKPKTDGEDDKDPIVCSLSDITVRDGFLVILVDANSADQLPKSVDAADPEVRSTAANGQSKSVNKQWMCSLCGHVYDQLHKLKTHIMKHTGERPHKCPVSGCKWAFTLPHKLKRHIERHIKTKDYPCKEPGCGKSFSTPYNLNSHMKLHRLPPKAPCPVEGCSAGFPTVNQLDRHLKEVHNTTREKKYVCPHPGCNKRFVSMTCIGSHKRVHDRDDLVCPYAGCEKVFDKNCRLQQHLLVHTGERPFKCKAEGCQWAFQTASKLKRHMNRHLNDRQFACTYEGCNKRFLRSEHLKGHLISHTGEKPFACSIEGCTSRFSSKSSMYVHIKTHKKMIEKASEIAEAIRYYCPMDKCNQAFDTKADLKTHIEKHYKLNPSLASRALPSHIARMPNLTPVSIAPVIQPRQSVLLPAQSLPTLASSVNTVPVASVPASSPGISLLPQNGGLISVPVVLSPELSQLRQEFLNVKGLSLPAMGGITGLPTLSRPAGGVPVHTGSSIIKKPLLFGQGSARTDARINEDVLQRSNQKRLLTKNKVVDQNTSQEDSVQNPSEPQPPAEEMMVNPNEILTSQAITFRDPETGAILIQTQLLQDDPPNLDVYPGENAPHVLETAEYTLGESELASMLTSDGSSSLPLDEPGVQFTGTTINLQDLE